jgi:uncharacterized protein YjbI with pentapeptide repeats
MGANQQGANLPAADLTGAILTNTQLGEKLLTTIAPGGRRDLISSKGQPLEWVNEWGNLR